MSRWEPMVFFYKRAKRPFYFPMKKPRFIRFSGQAFAFDYNFIGRFFYVLLEVGLKNQVVYKVPNFLQKQEALFSGRNLPSAKEDLFLFSPSFFITPFFCKAIGYFPINFFNSIFLTASWAKVTFAQQQLLCKKTMFKGTMQRVLVAVDSHLSLLFSGKRIHLPEFDNYVRTFKYAMQQIYLITGDHNVSSYTSRAEGSFFKFGAVSARRYRDSFFKSFFRALKVFFLNYLFFNSSPGISISYHSRMTLDFFFGFYYVSVIRTFKYLCYLKLFLGSFVFCWFQSFTFFKFFLVEFFSLVLGLQAASFYAAFGFFFQFSFFRKFFFCLVRIFTSGIFRDIFVPMAQGPKELRKLPLPSDLIFPRGLGLKFSFLFSSYRESVFKLALAKHGRKRRKLRRWLDNLGNFNFRKRRRWFNYIVGYYRKKKRKAFYFRGFRRLQRKYPPKYIYPSIGPVAQRLFNRPFALASSLYDGFVKSEEFYGHGIYPFLRPGVFWGDFRFAVLNYVAAVYNKRVRRLSALKKKRLDLLKSRVLSLTKARPLTIPRSRYSLSRKKGLKGAYGHGSRRAKKFFFFNTNSWCYRVSNPQRFRFIRGGFLKTGAVSPSNGQFLSTFVAVMAFNRRRLRKLKYSSLRRRPRFIFLTKRFVAFLMFFFCLDSELFRLKSRRLFFGISKISFLRLRKRLLNKRGFSLKRRPLAASLGSRKNFVFSIGNLLKRPLNNKMVSRKKKKGQFPLRKKLFFSFKKYRFCYFFNSAFFPFAFLLQKTALLRGSLDFSFYLGISFSAFAWAFGTAVPLCLRGAGFGIYITLAFSRFFLVAQKGVSFLFYFFDSFVRRGGFLRLLKRLVRPTRFTSTYSFYCFFTLQLFFLWAFLQEKLLRVGRRRLKGRKFLLKRDFFYTKKHQPSSAKGKNSLVYGRKKNYRAALFGKKGAFRPSYGKKSPYFKKKRIWF